MLYCQHNFISIILYTKFQNEATKWLRYLPMLSTRQDLKQLLIQAGLCVIDCCRVQWPERYLYLPLWGQLATKCWYYSDIPSCQSMVQGRFIEAAVHKLKLMRGRCSNSLPRLHSPFGVSQAPSNKLSPARRDSPLRPRFSHRNITTRHECRADGWIQLQRPEATKWLRYLPVLSTRQDLTHLFYIRVGGVALKPRLVRFWSMLAIGSQGAMWSMLSLLAQRSNAMWIHTCHCLPLGTNARLPVQPNSQSEGRKLASESASSATVELI